MFSPQGDLVAIKRLRKDSINLTRDILIEMKQVSTQYKSPVTK